MSGTVIEQKLVSVHKILPFEKSPTSSGLNGSYSTNHVQAYQLDMAMQKSNIDFVAIRPFAFVPAHLPRSMSRSCII